MKGLALGMMAGLATLVGCSNNEEAASATRPVAAQATASNSAAQGAAAAPVDYQEVRSDNAIYVLASKASADKVRGGQKLAHAVTAFGFGPAGEKVYFETDKDGKLEKVLMAEYAKRHGMR